MMKRRLTHGRLAVHLVALALCVCACSPRRTATATVRDDLGRTIAIGPLRRVVTLAPNITEIAFAIGAGDRIVATDDYSNEPREAKALPKIGGLNPSVERIAAVRPDLVLATTNGNPPSLEPSLKAAGIPLYVLRTDRITDIPRAMTALGGLLDASGAQRAATQVSAAVQRQRRTRARAPRVLFAVWTEPLYVGGRDTFADDLLVLTGARNAVTVQGWPQLSLETLAAQPPDLLVYPARSVSAQQIAALVQRVPTLSSAKIVVVDEDLFTRPGPRVGAAAAALNAILDEWERTAR